MLQSSSRWALPPILAYLVFFQIALQTAMRLPTQYLKMFQGLLLMLVAIFFAFFPNRINHRPRIRNGLLTGAPSGIGAGLAGIGGPPLAIYFLSALNDKEKYIGTIQFYFTLTNAIATFSRLLNGIIKPDLLLYACGLLGYLIGIMRTAGPQADQHRFAQEEPIPYIAIGRAQLHIIFEGNWNKGTACCAGRGHRMTVSGMARQAAGFAGCFADFSVFFRLFGRAPVARLL